VNYIGCPCSGASLARLVQPAAMAVLAEGAVHGYELVRRLRGLRMFRGRRPDPTGVYRVLKEMEDRQLVVSEWDLSDSGPARRAYALTAAGRGCLRRWVRTLEDYRAALGELTAAVKQSSGRKASLARQPRRVRSEGA
jgi:DNA-binding PadR family transcriptional regulator